MKHINLIKAVRTFLLLLLVITFGIVAVFRTAGAEESTYLVDIYDSNKRPETVFVVIDRLLEHDSEYLQIIGEITNKYKRTYSSNRKVLVRLDYVEARALHLKGWIVGIKKLKQLNEKSLQDSDRDYLSVKKWRSSEGRKELNGLYKGVSFLIVISGDKESKGRDVKARLQHMGDQVMLMEVCEYYRFMDDVDSLRKVKRSENKLDTAFNKNLAFLSGELKHLKNWYVEHARQG